MIIKENSVIFELYQKTFEFDKIPFALWKLSEVFELKIKDDAEKLHKNQKNGKALKVTNDGYNAEGKEQTSYQVIPWAWDNIDMVEECIKNIGSFVSKILNPYGILLNPDWNHISAPFVSKIKKIREILGEAQSNAFANAARQAVQIYQDAYDEELSRDYGLSFGILSNSLTAHLVYAAQATAKEMKDKERAENFVSSVAGNPMEQLLIAVFNVIHPLYIETAEPAILQVLAEYYAYVVSLFANELGYNYEEIANQFNIDNSIAVLNTSPVSKDTIFNALCKNPSNGVVVGYAITNSLIDDELMNYAYNSGPMFTSRMNNWATSKLTEVYDAGKLFNKPLVNENNIDILEKLKELYIFKSGNLIDSSEWQNLLISVYTEEIGKVLTAITSLSIPLMSPLDFEEAAKNHTQIHIPQKEKELFILFCNELPLDTIVSITSTLKLTMPVSMEPFDKAIADFNQKLKIRSEEIDAIAEENRQKAEEKRQIEAEERAYRLEKIKKYVITIVSVALSIIIIVPLTTDIIIPTINYNKAFSLFKNGKYDEAIIAFTNLDGFNGSETQIKNCKYYKAISLYENASYKQAIEIFNELENYEDSLEYVRKSSISLAKEAFSSKDYFAAATWYKNANALDEMNESRYLYVKSHYNNEDEITWVYLKDLKDINYKDSGSLYNELYKLHFEYVINDSRTDFSTHKTKFKFVSSYDGGAIFIHVKISGGYPGQKQFVEIDGNTGDIGFVECNGQWFTLADDMLLIYGQNSTTTKITINAGQFSEECMVTVYK